ncbi:L-fucose isomerase [Amygdalobacter nucleatus]|uniref:L-fucose isomerase n=1 Tax=Amygdalobacter nucleatus TaxID=3029274 RepID=A0A133YFI7_9FIRM|nr:L-fucose isomerase [Amygdalobacter nucleatus]KXB41965.1 arabinose isomerase [Amygdalobacter nucleatus]MDF0485728.1 L-fucose isomerase [Amygdalobacter nucleatus]
MNHPRIGIRPIIDGRRGGVRESLEEQCMGMATSAKALIESKLRYPDGEPVECIISPCTIGGAKEAATCEEYFSTKNVVATLSVTPCWCYGMETIDLNPLTIKAVWGFNGTERPGAVYLASVMAAYAQRGLPAFSIYGHDVQDKDDRTIKPDVEKKILDFARAAVAVGVMRNRSYVNIGGIAMGIAGSQVNSDFLQKYLGMRTEWVDMTEVLRRITLGIYDHEEFKKARAWVEKNCKVGMDINQGKELAEIIKKSRYIKEEEQWDFTVKHAMVVRDILFGNPKLAEMGWIEESLGRNAIAGGFQGQRMWTDWLPNADFTEAIMATSFDWNGKRAPVPFATENDTFNCISMLFGMLVTNKAAIFSDVRTYWSPESVKRVTGKELTGVSKNGIIHLINSGASCLDGSGAAKNEKGEGCMKEWWNMTDKDVQACLDATDWCRANYEYFRGGGYSSHFRTNAEMSATMIRCNMVEGVGPTLQVIEGYTCKIDDEIHKILDDRTDKTWPTTWFAPILNKDTAPTVYDMMAKWGANHGATVYGHVGDRLITLASMLRIPVVFHNVEKERIYRPHTFNGFGTKDLEGQDFRACEFYGPMYR